jgi:hypothetical protein
MLLLHMMLTYIYIYQKLNYIVSYYHVIQGWHYPLPYHEYKSRIKQLANTDLHLNLWTIA